MKINNFSTNYNTSFGVEFSPQLFKPLENLSVRVFKVDKYLVKRKNPVGYHPFPLPGGSRERLRSAFETIDMALPGNYNKLYPYVNKKGETFFALDLNNKRYVLNKINGGKKYIPGDFDTLKLKLSEVETLAFKLYKLDKKENRKIFWSEFLRKFWGKI